MVKLIKEFTAIDESGGEHTLLVYQEVVSAATRLNPSAEAPGLKRIETERGEAVNGLNKGEYQVVATGAILRSSDPAAP